MDPLHHLPLEIVYAILDLLRCRSLLCLARCNSAYRDLLLPILYECDYKTLPPLLEYQHGVHGYGRPIYAIHWACQNGYHHPVMMAIALARRYPGYLEVEDGQGHRPLTIAATNGHADICRVLLRHGAQPWPRTYGRDTPLSVAATGNRLDIVRMLLNSGNVSPDKLDAALICEATALTLASMKDHKHVVLALLRAGSDWYGRAWGVSAFLYTDTPLHMAVRMNAMAAVEVLVRNRPKPTVDVTSGPSQTTPLQLAVQADNVEIVRLLVGIGQANPSFRPRYDVDSPVGSAVKGGKDAILEVLLDSGRVDMAAEVSRLADNSVAIKKLLQMAKARNRS